MLVREVAHADLMYSWKRTNFNWRNNFMIEEMKKYFDEITKDAKLDCSHISFPIIVDKPTGVKQTYDGNTSIFSHVYVDQKKGCCEDDYYGYMYYPIEDKYLKVGYVC